MNKGQEVKVQAARKLTALLKSKKQRLDAESEPYLRELAAPASDNDDEEEGRQAPVHVPRGLEEWTELFPEYSKSDIAPPSET